jgi:hypothetical protein
VAADLSVRLPVGFDPLWAKRLLLRDGSAGGYPPARRLCRPVGPQTEGMISRPEPGKR